MDIRTIKNIRLYRDSIREQIKAVNFKEFDDDTFGTEDEYSFRGIIGGIEALMTDISTLTRAPKKFIKLSNYDERNEILRILKNIDSNLVSPEYFIDDFESLKALLRSFNIRNFSERQIEFEEEIEAARKTKLQFQQELIEVKKIKEEISSNKETVDDKYKKINSLLKELEEEIDKVKVKKETLEATSQDLEETNSLMLSIKETAEENLDEIKELLTESKSNEKLISSFAKNVQERDNKLSQLEQNTDENNKKLIEYDKERKNLLKEAQGLIDSAKEALNYKTAEGISASFQEHYNDMTGKSLTDRWLVGATLCLLATISLGIWVLNASDSNVGLIIGRVSLLPLPIIGAVFCANQYTKQKNIIEDYAYKMVLSKAIVGFSEQLKENGSKDNEEYIHYIKTALEEIHKDPLRKREKNKGGKSTNLNELVEVAEKIVNMSKLNQ